jgi:hypothetical protein
MESKKPVKPLLHYAFRRKCASGRSYRSSGVAEFESGEGKKDSIAVA